MVGEAVSSLGVGQIHGLRQGLADKELSGGLMLQAWDMNGTVEVVFWDAAYHAHFSFLVFFLKFSFCCLLHFSFPLYSYKLSITSCDQQIDF